jgi:hypothetical protein
MMNKYIFTNGTAAKSLDFGNPIRDSWDFVDAMSSMPEGELYARVSAVYRAANLTADAVAHVPFALVRNGEDYDTSADWKNKVGFMPRPKDLLRLWRLSLFMTNTAYARIGQVNRLKKQLFYVSPDTMKINTNPRTGEVTSIEREIGGQVVASYSMDSRDLVKFWRVDHTTELLPSKNTELKAMLNAANILYAADWWTQNYFSRGAVKPTILAVKGMASIEKREELQGSFAKFMRSLGTRISDLAKIINAETMDVKQIGDGLGDIKDTPVYRQSLENIAMASGMPLSLLLANSANYATAQAEYAAWYRDSITPYAEWMQEVLNEEIFKSLGLQFEFRAEQAEPAQEEEVQRAGAFQTYVNAGIPVHIAAEIVGVDLPVGMTYDDLKPEPQPEPEPPAPVEEEEEEEEDGEMSIRAWDELDAWRKKAIRYTKRGKAATFDFVTEHIPAEIAANIRARLAAAGTPDEVKAAFNVGDFRAEQPQDDSVKTLADALNNAAAAMGIKAEPMQQPVINVTMPSINLTATMPEQQAAQVTVNVPEQQAAQVTVNVPEQPAPVVNVAPADVKIDNVVNVPERKPIEAELFTDPRTGRKTLRAK